LHQKHNLLAFLSSITLFLTHLVGFMVGL
jgi:hypothetical protein